jgi:hypothetical protein
MEVHEGSGIEQGGRQERASHDIGQFPKIRHGDDFFRPFDLYVPKITARLDPDPSGSQDSVDPEGSPQALEKPDDCSRVRADLEFGL